MRSFNTRGAQAQVRLENFSGLQYRAPAKDTSAAYDLCNLRRMSDGTLSRREGFSPIATLPDTVRGVYCCVQNGESVIYAVAGDGIYALRAQEDGSYLEQRIGQTESSEGEVQFFSLDGDVVLMDGQAMYCLRPRAATGMTPYIPLYGKDWTSEEYGTVFEPRNALTDQVHLRYRMSANVRVIYLRIAPVSIDAVLIKGEVLDPSSYSYDSTSAMLELTRSVGPEEAVDVLMTLPPEEGSAALREDFARCQMAVRPGESGRTVVLFGGGNETGVLYLSRDIARENRERCRACFPQACMLYLQADGRIELGDGFSKVNALVRHYDRTLVMTSGGTWSAQARELVTGATGSAFGMVNSRLGCTAPAGALLAGNSPISLCGKDVLLWNAETDTLDECNASVLSDPIAALLPEGLGEQGRLFLDNGKREVWLYLADGSARVFVWQQSQSCWTSFDFGSMAPRCAYDCFGAVGFASGRVLYLAASDAVCDVDAEGNSQPILCSYVSHRLNFGHKGQSLRPYEVMLCAEAAAGSEITVTVESADGAQAYVTLLCSGEQPFETQRRISIGRCRHALVRVDCAAAGALTLRSIGLAAGL